ncbi:MAG: hypothetical protein KF781_02275 [Chitinophagaceae bacterium]|nr:hypothetical protein [Chitinophagaceae bacterium]MCW5904336.1 hypothetical protein [Chitinophagaceae bacterium]
MSVLFCSCVSYNARMNTYYNQLEQKQYSKALRTLDKTKFIQKDRNKLLFYFEKGKTYHLMQEYDSSNVYFNLADNFIDTRKKNIGDVIKANLINPMMQIYLGEDMERFMMHYYKGLNYLYIHQPSEALVEARRITLAENIQSDKFKNKNNRYSKDAFALNVQGMLYEANGDINNAFIAYRNAVDVYLNAKGEYYGVQLPKQLQQDVLRTANQMGFYDQQQYYENIFKTTLQQENSEGGYLILFLEQGAAPIKSEKSFYITKGIGGINSFYFYDENGYQTNVPFDFADYTYINMNDANLAKLRTFHVAIPYYQIRYSNTYNFTIATNNITYSTELAQNINSLAVNILKERMFTEIANALARQIVKKLAEKAVEASAEEIYKSSTKNKTDSTKTEQEKKKEEDKKNEKAKNVGELTGLIANIINTATEKADTRNWQSLPAFIHYVRIPLKAGENTITISGKNNATTTITIQGNGKLQFLDKSFLK